MRPVKGNPRSEQAAGAGTAGIDRSNQQSQFNTRSTATAIQLPKLKALLSTRPHHTYELRAKGISHPAGRVSDLELLGYVIEASRITTVDGDGFIHKGVALYELVSEPAGGVVHD